MSDARSALPSVSRLLEEPGIRALLDSHPRALVVRALREALAAVREGRAGPPEDWSAEVAERVDRASAGSLLPVLNATGVILHTNLGRAPLAEPALAALQAVASGYSTLEFDRATGTRGSRNDHCAALLAECTGAEAGFVVNNAAGALLLALNTVAEGREVLISRGELIEIGGSFRIPDILGRSGARLREVGTTNRTHLADYEAALGPATGAILTVHRSNFEQRGFVATPDPRDLAALAHRASLPYLHDVGSGLLLDLAGYGLAGEPLPARALEAGADLVLFSGDKLLGGPQAGCLVGREALLAPARKNPLARALRADKLTLAGLEATLALYREPARALAEIPVLRMLTRSADALQADARVLLAALEPAIGGVKLVPGNSSVGGGAFPGAELATTLVAVPVPAEIGGANAFALRLRLGTPPLIARIQDDQLVLDPRTLPPGALEEAAAAVRRALTE